jgi:biotin carboxylase
VTLLVLNRRPIIEQIPGWLADLGEEIVLITSRSAISENTLAVVGDSYREIVAVDDYHASNMYGLIVKTVQQHACRRILSTAEADVLRAARVRAELGMPGQDLLSAHAYRNKVTMKRHLVAAGMPIDLPAEIRNANALRDFARDHDFPVVVKPCDGGGSVGITVINGPAALERWVQNASEDVWRTYIAEAWVNGPVYHVDGLMSAGSVIQSWPSRYGHPNLATVTESRPSSSWMLSADHPMFDRLRSYVQDIVTHLPAVTDVIAFHAEVFHSPGDNLMLCEIACRPGGVGIVPTYELAFDVNLYAATLRGQAGVSPSEFACNPAPELMAGFVWFPPFAATLHSLPAECPVDGVYRYEPVGKAGHRYERPRSSGDHLARVFVAGTVCKDLEPVLARVESWWTETACWAAS